MAVRVEGISKLYRIGARREERSFRQTVAELLSSRPQLGGDRDLWALRDVTFDVPRGEAVGIIGQNGAGKSTLLKILSRITEPTSGRIELHGRVSSLLEVGTGFHPELTGRENIQLNGAILGMRRAEIRERFDEIVAFAEVERFIDTAVKYYSSGMYMRLAFAVAAHLEPEILVVDEVLAVGDAAFQAKCLRKMGDVASHGRTVLFVSHNMPAVKNLCQHAVWLRQGRVVEMGPSDAIVNAYLQTSVASVGLSELAEQISRLPLDPSFRLFDVGIGQRGVRTSNLLSGDPVEIEIEYEVYDAVPGLHVYFGLYDLEETLIFESLHNGEEPGLPIVKRGHYRSVAVIPADFLAPRAYRVEIRAAISNLRALIPEPLRITVDVQPSGIVNRAYAGYVTGGRIAPRLIWQTELTPLPSNGHRHEDVDRG